MIISIQGGEIRLFTRNNNDVTHTYPELLDVPIDNKSDTVLDGEVACIDPKTGIVATLRLPVIFFAFDILRYKGKDIRSCPLLECKAILSQVLAANSHFKRVLSVEGSGIALFEAIKLKKLEGIVAKVKESKYVGRRDANWLKIINYSYADVQVFAYRKDPFGWMLKHEERPVGILELSVSPAHKQAFYEVAKNLVTGEDRKYVYIKPSIKTRVRFRNWYHPGMIRSPEFVDFVI
jgi:DNA ligase 1